MITKHRVTCISGLETENYGLRLDCSALDLAVRSNNRCAMRAELHDARVLGDATRILWTHVRGHELVIATQPPNPPTVRRCVVIDTRETYDTLEQAQEGVDVNSL